MARKPPGKKNKKSEPEKSRSQDQQNADKLVQIAVAGIEKQFGKGSVMVLGENGTKFKDVEVLPTGSIGLDIALGVMGCPRGRIMEIFGPESCLAGETFLRYEVWQGDHKLNHKGGSIRRLAERFHNQHTEKEPKQGRHLQVNEDVDFYVKSVDDEGRIFRNLVLDVVHTGHKSCFQVRTETGQTLRATLEHKFMTPNGFIPLSDLEVGSEVLVHNNTRVRGRKKYTTRPTTTVKYHPHWPTKIVHDKKTGRDHVYYRGQSSRLVYEAFLNRTTPENYTEALNTWAPSKIRDLRFLPDDIHVHHKDEDFTNNDIGNLQLLDPSLHGRMHAKDKIRNLSFIVTPSKITEISEVGIQDTYDLRCEYPYNNYIAEGIVVHNSGKTTLALHILAEAQAKGENVAFVDAEHALDPKYAENIGVDIGRLFISQPDYGEQCLEITDHFVRSGGMSVVVIDSVAALTPKAELEGEMGDHHVGLQARLMGQAMRKLTSIVSRSNTLVIFINQTRMKIGVKFGSPETTTGGNALKFYSSLRFDIRRIGAIKQGENILGNRTRVKVVKNKLAPPFKEAEFDIMYGKGISRSGELLDLGVEKGIVEKSGAWYSFGSERIGQGRENAKQFLEEHTNYAKQIEKKIKDAYANK